VSSIDYARACPSFAAHNRVPGLRLFLLLVLSIGQVCPLSAAATVSAQLDRQSVPLGEDVVLTLTFQGASPPNAPALPQIPGLRPGGVGRSSSVTMINGRTTSTTSFSYTLTPERMGTIIIPAMQVQLNGERLATPALALRVTEQNPATATTNLAFIRLVVPKKQVYIGEPFPVEMHLYWQNAQDVGIPELQANGFALGEAPRPQQTQTRVGNQLYQMAVIKRAATAATTGNLTLGPATSQLTLRISRSNQPRSPFGIFGGNFQLRRVTVTSETQTLQVLPLPPNAPPSFNGAVGNYSLNVKASPTTLSVGDPITLRAQITGRGVIAGLDLPPQSNWREDDFKTYPPTSSVQTTDDLGLVGTKSFEQVIIPQNHEIHVLPPLEFTYFDVSRRRYHTLTNQPIPLTVQPSTGQAPPPVLTNAATGPETEPPRDDIVHIRPILEAARVASFPLVSKPWFLLLQFFPPLTWVTLVLLRKRSEALANNPRLRRRKEVDQKVREGLKELQNHAQKNQSDPFFALLFRLLQEQLGERIDLPASAITEAVVTERLSGRGLPEETMSTLHELFLLCNQARYASQTSQELASIVPRVQATFDRLKDLKV